MYTQPRIEHVKRTTQGKLAAATQRQSAEYLKPLFKLLRARVRLSKFPPELRRLLTPYTESSSRYARSYRRDCPSHAEETVPKG